MMDPLNTLIVGLLVGAGVGGHALRCVVLSEDLIPDDKQRGRYFIAISAIVFYSISAVLVGMGLTAGLVLSVVGPFIGVTAVLLLKQRIDRFQKVLGVFQAMPLLLALYLLTLKLIAWMAT